MKYKTLFSLPLIALLLGCTNTNPVVDQRVFSFDTYINIRLYEGKKTDGEYLEELIAKYDKLSDNYQNRDISNVYTINHTNDDVTISEELYKLLKTSFDVNKEGATYFNPLCGSLAKRWKEALKNKQILDETIKNEELLKMQNTTLTFKENNVVQRLGDAEIDLGGIAKGYVLDRALDTDEAAADDRKDHAEQNGQSVNFAKIVKDREHGKPPEIKGRLLMQSAHEWNARREAQPQWRAYRNAMGCHAPSGERSQRLDTCCHRALCVPHRYHRSSLFRIGSDV